MARTKKEEQKKTTAKVKGINETVQVDNGAEDLEKGKLGKQDECINEVVTGDPNQDNVETDKIDQPVENVEKDEEPVDDQINEEGFHEGTEHGSLNEIPNQAEESVQLNEELQAEREIGYQNGGAGQTVEGDLSWQGLEQMQGLTLNNSDVEKLDSFQRNIEPVYVDFPENQYQKKTLQYTATNAKDCRVCNDAEPDYTAQCPPKEKTENPGAYIAQRPY